MDGDDDAVGPYVVHAIRDTPVETPDDRLRDAVESVFSALGRGAITAGDLASLQAFNSPSARIERLDGFGHAARLHGHGPRRQRSLLRPHRDLAAPPEGDRSGRAADQLLARVAPECAPMSAFTIQAEPPAEDDVVAD